MISPTDINTTVTHAAKSANVKFCKQVLLFVIVFVEERSTLSKTREKGKLWAHAIKRVAAGAYLPTSWLFEPAKRPDDKADYCLDCSFLPQWKHRVLVFTFEWSGARPVGEQWLGLAPTSSAEFFLCLKKKPVGTSEFRLRDLTTLSDTLSCCATLARYSKRFTKPTSTFLPSASWSSIVGGAPGTSVNAVL